MKTPPTTALATRGQLRALATQNRARAHELLALLRRKMSDVTDAFFEMGAALAELSNNRLYAALGYPSFDAFLESEHLMGQTQANKLMLVATRVPRENAVVLGQEKAYAVMRYAQLAHADADLAELTRPSARIGGRAVADLSVRDIRAEIQRVRHRARGGRPPPHANPLLGAAKAFLKRRGLKEARVRGGRRGKHPVVHLELTQSDLERLTGTRVKTDG